MAGPQLKLVRGGKGEPESIVLPGEVFADLAEDPWWEKNPQLENPETDSRRERGMKRVGILTDFFSIDPAYSLTNVAGNQIKMLLRHGYDPLVLVDEYFPEQSDVPFPWNSVRLFKLPSIPRSNRAELPKDWEKHLGKMTEAMREGLKDIEVVLSHDLIYQPAQILYLMAAREIDKERDGSIHWLHWIHSATPPALINTQDVYLKSVSLKFPHSFLVFPNEYSRARVARNFGYEEHEVKCVPHPTDFPEFFGFQEITKKLIDAKGMLGAEFIACYPIRLDRGKNVEFCLRIFAQLKKLGRSVRLIIIPFHSTGGDKVHYQRDLVQLGQRLGLSGDELVFTNEFDESLKVRCPREMVRDLFLLSNIYIHPSRSETYSLVVQESILAGCFPILNFDFPPMMDIYGQEPLYAKFSSNIDAMTGFDGDTKVEYQPNVDAYCKDVALRIISEYTQNRLMRLRTRLRRTRGIDSVFRNYLEPLLYSW